jgi:hypothetical protein
MCLFNFYTAALYTPPSNSLILLISYLSCRCRSLPITIPFKRSWLKPLLKESLKHRKYPNGRKALTGRFDDFCLLSVCCLLQVVVGGGGEICLSLSLSSTFFEQIIFSCILFVFFCHANFVTPIRYSPIYICSISF